jgi:hypothetical protein
MNGVANNKHTPNGKRPGCMEAQARKQDNPFLAAEAAFGELKRNLVESECMVMTHREVEDFVNVHGRDVLRLLLQGQFTLRGLRVATAPVIGADGIERTHVRERGRGLETIFGEVEVERLCHGQRGVDSLAVVDAELSLPTELYSLGLRRLVASEAAKVSFDEVVASVKSATGVDIPKRQVEQLAMRAAQDMEAFYVARAAAANRSAGEILAITTDGKGISMRREDLRPATRKAAEQRRPKRQKRRSKGEKSMTRRMAQVASVYEIAPHMRAAEDIVHGLHPAPGEPAPKQPKPERKRVWASVEHDAATVIGQAFQEAEKRDPEHRKRWVVLLDGASHQRDCVQSCIRKAGVEAVIIADIIHVIEYLWGAANAFFGEGANPAEAWVDERLLRILCGGVSDVAAGMRRSATKRGLTAAQRQPIDRCANYLLNLKDYMRYDQYLAAGFPIATGVIEGACRYLVKDRMDITGARWTVAGAEAVLRLRALRASGDFEEYWAFHEARHHQSTHLDRYANATIPQAVDPSHSRRKPTLRVVP